MGWLGDGSHRGQGCQAWTAVGLPPRYSLAYWEQRGYNSPQRRAIYTSKESRSGGLTPPLTCPPSSRQWELKLKKKRLEDDGTSQLMCMLNVHYSVHAPASSQIPTTSLVASIRQRISTYPIPSPATRHGIWSRTVTSRNLMHKELHWLDIPERVSYKHCSASWTLLTSDWQGAGSVQPLNSPLDNITLRSASPADDSTTSAQNVWQSPLVQRFQCSVR